MSTLQRRRMMMAQGVTYEGIPLTITNVSDNNVVISIRIYGGLAPLLYYKKGDRKTYRRWNYNNITLQPQESMDIFGDNPEGFSKSQKEYINFKSSGDISVSGRVSSLSSAIRNYNYVYLFQNANVVNISEDLFAGVNLTSYCFYNTFSYNKSLQEVPPNLLPFTTLSTYCYQAMFEKTGIKKVPANFLPATNALNAYANMFSNSDVSDIEVGAVKATSAISLSSMFQSCPLENIKEGAFESISSGGNGTFTRMFANCKFYSAPTQLALNGRNNYVYANLLENNKNLQYVGEDFFNNLSLPLNQDKLFNFIFSGCTSLQSVSIPYGNNKANRQNLFLNAFNGCTSLNRIEVKFTSWTYIDTKGVEQQITPNWLTNVSPTGTFICPKELADATDGYYDEEGNFVEGVGRGVDTVPEGWTIDYPIIDARDGDANAMALLTALVEYGLCPRGEYLMNSEADAITSINSVFKGNTQITDFTAFQFFNGIKTLGAGNEATSPFAGSTLTRIVLPDTLNVINNYAFYNCSALEYVSIGKNITTISDRAFYLCKNLSRADYRGTLEGWLNINIWLMGNPMVIGADLYINGELLAGDIVIPESITYIKQRILEGGKYITSITINHEITNIELNAFAGCSSLAYIVLKSSNPPTLQSSAIPSKTIIYVPEEFVAAYKAAAVWSTMADRIKPISELPQE